MTVVFLDRDGVINRDRDDYVKNIGEFVFLPGVLEGLAKLKKAGIAAAVVSNQAGVGRGLIGPADLESINRRMLAEVVEHGGEISGSYYCTHRRDEGCGCRKPETGLFREAVADLDIELSDSYLIGDSASDIEAGQKAGCRTILVLTGKSSADEAAAWSSKPTHIASDFQAAVDWILAVRRAERQVQKLLRPHPSS